MSSAVYTASKLHHAPMWLRIRAEWPEVKFTARWPDLVGNVSDEQLNARVFWLHDIADVQKADAVLLYAEGDEHLRGALVEAGAALGLGKRVICVGDHPDYGTWQHHPMVTRLTTLAEARLDISGWWSCPTAPHHPIAEPALREGG